MSLLAPATPTRQRILTLMLAGLGTLVFWALNLPLPFLFGPLSASLLAAMLGARLRGFGQISVGARTILGVAVGASVTPQLLGTLPQMAASVALVPLYIAIIAVIALGFLAFAGRLSWFTAGAVVLGIGLVFGAPAIVDEMIAAVGN